MLSQGPNPKTYVTINRKLNDGRGYLSENGGYHYSILASALDNHPAARKGSFQITQRWLWFDGC